MPTGTLWLKFTHFMKRGGCSINPEEGEEGALHTALPGERPSDVGGEGGPSLVVHLLCFRSGLSALHSSPLGGELGRRGAPGSPACSPRCCSSNLRVLPLPPAVGIPCSLPCWTVAAPCEQGCLFLAERPPLEQGIGYVLSDHIL